MPKEDKKLSPLLYSAVELAFKLHGHDTRKQSNVPYIAHLLSVCAMVQLDGGDEEEAIAALLHDALEDKPEEISRDQIGKLFGEKVLKIVELSTDTPRDYAGGVKPPWRERKEAYIAHIRETEPSLLRVTVADKVDNARSILADYHRLGEKVWQRFNAGKEEQLWYLRSCIKGFEKVGFKGLLLEELRRLVNQLIELSEESSQ